MIQTPYGMLEITLESSTNGQIAMGRGSSSSFSYSSKEILPPAQIEGRSYMVHSYIWRSMQGWHFDKFAIRTLPRNEYPNNPLFVENVKRVLLGTMNKWSLDKDNERKMDTADLIFVHNELVRERKEGTRLAQQLAAVQRNINILKDRQRQLIGYHNGEEETSLFSGKAIHGKLQEKPTPKWIGQNREPHEPRPVKGKPPESKSEHVKMRDSAEKAKAIAPTVVIKKETQKTS
jgi:hypothetical protein